jgi:uncharacterized protein YcfJ
VDNKILAVLVVIIVIIAITIPVIILLGEEEERTDAIIHINEIMYDPYGDDAGKEWIELYNPSEKTESLEGWTLVNRSGTVIALLPDWEMPSGAYLIVYLGEGQNDQDLSDGLGTYHTGSTNARLNNVQEELAVSAGSLSRVNIVDFTCWCSNNDYHQGESAKIAIEAGIWTEGDYFDVGFPSGNSMVAGFSMGRNDLSTETGTPTDWARNGGKNAYFATPGRANNAPYFDANESIKLVQTKANLFLMEWGYDILEASHTTIEEYSDATNTSVEAEHRFLVDMGNATFNLTGEGQYHWWRVNNTLWRDEMELALEVEGGYSWMNLTYERYYLDTGLIQEIHEETECIESTWEPENDTEDEPAPVEQTLYLNQERYASDSTMTVTQLGLNHYSVNTSDLRELDFRNETQVMEFSKEYQIIEDDTIEAWTDLTMTSDVRESMNVSTHYTQISDVGWHRVNDLGNIETDYHEYNVSYGNVHYQMVEEGHFTMLEVENDHYTINWSVPVETEDLVENNTMNVGLTGHIVVDEVDGETIYRGNITSNDSNLTQRFCIDGYESVVGGGVCAIAGGLIGSIFVGIGAVIGGGIGAAACGAAGYAVEEANEEDDEKPTIEFEIGDSGSNKEKGWVKITITISDNEEVDKVKYKSHSSNQGKNWYKTYKKDAKTKTLTRTFNNPKCTEDWRTVTIKAQDKAGNTAVESKQIRVPARDCTPNVKSTSPENESCCVPTTSHIVVEFCKPMNKTSAENAIIVSPTTDYVVSWSTDNTTITLIPVGGLEANTVYEVTITTEAKSWAERPLLENYTFWFETVDTILPDITILKPLNGEVFDIPIIDVVGFVTDSKGIVEVGYLISWDMGEENVSFTIDPSETNHSYNFAVELHVGANTIIVWALDNSGNYGEMEIMVVYEPLA